MSSQSGTHAESARHVRDDSASLDELELPIFWGLCTVLDVTASTGPIVADEVFPSLSPLVERLLLKTFAEPDWAVWPTDFRPIAPELIEELARRGCRLIGTDAPSIDPANSKALAAHQAAHRTGMAILEGVVLDKVPEGQYELVALPLPIDAVEATPVRAALRTLDEARRLGSHAG